MIDINAINTESINATADTHQDTEDIGPCIELMEEQHRALSSGRGYEYSKYSNNQIRLDGKQFREALINSFIV